MYQQILINEENRFLAYFFEIITEPLKIYELNTYKSFLGIRMLLGENYNDSFFNSSQIILRFDLCR